MLTRAICVIALTVLLCQPAAAERPTLQEELVSLEVERQAAYVAADRHLLERHFAEEYVHTNLRGGRTYRAEELDFYSPGAFSLEAGRIEGVEVHRYGAVATLIGTVTWDGAKYHPPGTDITVDLSGRYSVSRVYVRRQGRWQLALSHASQQAGTDAPQ